MKSLQFIKIISGIILFFLILNIFFYKDIVSKTSYHLEKDGVCMIPNILTPSEIVYLNDLCKTGNYKEMQNYLIDHSLLKSECLKQTNNDYVFQDYMYIIQKSTIHTCHRDNNGDFFNPGQKHPSYTVLVYLEPMEKCLGIIPTSHLKKDSFGINMSDPIVNLPCKPGDVIIFNANLIHVGAMNQTDNHLRCQMKLTHREDISKLTYYQDFHKVLNQENNVPVFLRQIQKRGSCALPIISNMIQSEQVRTVRGSEDGTNIGVFQKMFSYFFYGNKDFYDLPNSF